MATAALAFCSKQYTFADGAVGLAALNAANGKVGYAFVQAFVLGVMCNALVCLAIWMSYSARTAIDKIAVVVPPIAAFVAAGFEHCIANIYYIPLGLFIKAGASEVLLVALERRRQFPALTWENFVVANLLPVRSATCSADRPRWPRLLVHLPAGLSPLAVRLAGQSFRISGDPSQQYTVRQTKPQYGALRYPAENRRHGRRQSNWKSNQDFAVGKGATIQRYAAIVGEDRFEIDVAPWGEGRFTVDGRRDRAHRRRQGHPAGLQRSQCPCRAVP